jgi:hypothetical protein
MSHGHKHPTGFEDQNRCNMKVVYYTGDDAQDRLITTVDFSVKFIIIMKIDDTGGANDGKIEIDYYMRYDPKSDAFHIVSSFGDSQYGIRNNNSLKVLNDDAALEDLSAIWVNVANADAFFNDSDYYYVMHIFGYSPPQEVVSV